MADLLPIEVSYALPREQVILKLDVPQGTTLQQAIEKSGIAQRFPQIDLARDKVGVFGKLRALTDVVERGDRVEVYRELIADPKAVRRERAAQADAKKAKARG